MEPALDDREAMRRWVETWKITGEELDRMKWEELRDDGRGRGEDARFAALAGG